MSITLNNYLGNGCVSIVFFYRLSLSLYAKYYNITHYMLAHQLSVHNRSIQSFSKWPSAHEKYQNNEMIVTVCIIIIITMWHYSSRGKGSLQFHFDGGFSGIFKRAPLYLRLLSHSKVENGDPFPLDG